MMKAVWFLWELDMEAVSSESKSAQIKNLSLVLEKMVPSYTGCIQSQVNHNKEKEKMLKFLSIN